MSVRCFRFSSKCPGTKEAENQRLCNQANIAKIPRATMLSSEIRRLHTMSYVSSVSGRTIPISRAPNARYMERPIRAPAVICLPGVRSLPWSPARKSSIRKSER